MRHRRRSCLDAVDFHVHAGIVRLGLVLYWITNNTITFIQQYTIMAMHGKRPDLFGNIRAGFKRSKPASK